MTWTYTNSPSTNTRDEVRFLSGDTTSTATVTLSDEEIAYLLTNQGSALGAAIAACEQLMAQWLDQPESQSTGGLSISRGDMVSKFQAKANALRRRMRVAPYVGGISKSDIEANELDSDWDQPVGKVGGDEYPGTGDTPEVS